MPRRWFVLPWFVVALSVLAAMSAAQSRSGEQSRGTQPIGKAKPLPPSEHLPATLWYTNAIKETALEICAHPGDLCIQVLSSLNDALERVRGLTTQCRWICPPGDCGPDCAQYHHKSFLDMDIKAIPLELHLPAMEWYASALENAAILYASDAQSFPRIEKELKAALDKVTGMRPKKK